MDIKAQVEKMNKFRGILINSYSKFKADKKDQKLKDQFIEALFMTACYLPFKTVKAVLYREVLGMTYDDLKKPLQVNDRSNSYYHYNYFNLFINEDHKDLTKAFLYRIESPETWNKFTNDLEALFMELD